MFAWLFLFCCGNMRTKHFPLPPEEQTVGTWVPGRKKVELGPRVTLSRYRIEARGCLQI
jgi:hypothetical protein